MKRALTTLTAVVAGSVVAATAFAAPATTADDRAARPAHILEVEYSEDYERIGGRRHSVFATVRGHADHVNARASGRTPSGRLDESAGPHAIWDFRDRRFVRGLVDDLRRDGRATVRVTAVERAGPGGESRRVRKRCELVFEPDPQFGDYAGGECRRMWTSAGAAG